MESGAMKPAKIYINSGFTEYLTANRLWQGIPGIEKTENGRFFMSLYSGGKTEEPGNVIVVEMSDDGEKWTDGWVVVKHDDPEVRCFDECLWIDPNGRLHLFWTQSRFYFDGRHGVWMATCENPDAENPVFSEPRRIANGVMLNKPTVRSNGEWLMPCALWNDYCNLPCEDHPELANEVSANIYVSEDNGETFYLRGGFDAPDRTFDEHMLIERKDGRIWMLIRYKHGIYQAFSRDGGVTWDNPGFSGHVGPNSRFFIRRLSSGKILLINNINPTYLTNKKIWNIRNNLMAMLSNDDGKTWYGGLMLDTRNDVTYPDGVEDKDGRIYITYDHDRMGEREILLASFTEADVEAGRLVSDGSFLQKVINKATGKKDK